MRGRRAIVAAADAGAAMATAAIIRASAALVTPRRGVVVKGGCSATRTAGSAALHLVGAPQRIAPASRPGARSGGGGSGLVLHQSGRGRGRRRTSSRPAKAAVGTTSFPSYMSGIEASARPPPRGMLSK